MRSERLFPWARHRAGTTGPRRAARAVALGGAALLLAGTAACGGSGDDGDGDGGSEASADTVRTDPEVLAAVRAAADSAGRTTSASFEASLTGSGAQDGGVTAEGVMSWGDDPAIDATVEGDALGLGPAAPAETHVLWVGDTVWASLDGAFAAEFDGRDWLRVDVAEVAEDSGGSDGAVAGAVASALDTAAQDPADQLALLLRAPGIESVGTEDINGTTAEHYRGTVSLADALAAEGDGQDGQLTDAQRHRLTEAAERQGVESWTIDAWVGEDDFPVRLSQRYTTTTGELTYQVDYADLGTEVAVTEPPADRAVDFDEVLEAVLGGLGG
ncbi:hypothetical protein [Streptomyces avicenniae]|uniref:hypothetical protein n=1 Tax=Streptomyces avicenniae TaxID=500153 RepID=UPI00069C4ADA|nr:hypothetical protein [Streptomyces avicenniae]